MVRKSVRFCLLLIVTTIWLTQCSWWHPTPKPVPGVLLQTLNFGPRESVTYMQGSPVRQMWTDERGQPERIVYFNLNRQKIRMDLFVQPNYNLIHQQIFSFPDSQLIWSVQTTSEDERVISRDWNDTNGRSLGEETYAYSPSGELTEETMKNAEGKILRRQTHSSSEWQALTYDLDGHARTYVVHTSAPFYWFYNLTPAGKIKRTELRTRDDLVIWRAEMTIPAPQKDLLKLYTGTGQLILQTERKNSAGIFLTRDSIPKVQSSIWSDGSLFNMEYLSLSDSNAVETWRTTAGNLLVRKRQINSRTEIPIEDIFYFSTAPQHPMVWYAYNSDGNLRRITNYTQTGDIGWTQEFERSPDGLRINSTLVNGQDDRHETQWYQYSSDGQLIATEHRGPFGKFVGSTQYFSDGPLPLTRERYAKSEVTKDITCLPSGDTLYWATYKNLDVIWLGMYYDSKGRLTAQKRLTPDEIFGQTIYFAPDGRRTSEEFLRKDGSVFQRKRYFDRLSQIRIRESFGLDGELTGVDSIYLRPDGQVRQIVSRDELGMLKMAERYRFENDKVISSERLNRAGTIMTQSVFHYDSLGHPETTEVSDSTGQLISRTHFAYDKAGQNIGEQIQNATGEIIEEHRFQYDAQGQLFREQVLQEGQLMETIEYQYLPAYKLRVANHFSADGELGRSEIEDFPRVTF